MIFTSELFQSQITFPVDFYHLFFSFPPYIFSSTYQMPSLTLQTSITHSSDARRRQCTSRHSPGCPQHRNKKSGTQDPTRTTRTAFVIGCAREPASPLQSACVSHILAMVYCKLYSFVSYCNKGGGEVECAYYNAWKSCGYATGTAY